MLVEYVVDKVVVRDNPGDMVIGDEDSVTDFVSEFDEV